MKSAKKTATISQVAEILSGKKTIALFAHTNPDGDTVGSCVALCLALKKLGKDVALFCDMELSNTLAKFIQGENFCREFYGKYDLLVAVDCGYINRLGEFYSFYSRFDETLTVDHHGGEYFSKYNCVTHYASTCQMIYEILQELHVELDNAIATSLYMGLCTDTGNFMHNNTDSASFAMAAELCKYGVDTEQVGRVFFKDTSLNETRLVGRALSRLRTYYDDKLVLLYVTQKDLDELGLELSATSGLVQHAINIDTCKVGVCITESKPNNYKVSMRGKGISVRDICQDFGGGGHVAAAGCMISGFLEDVIDKIVRVVGYSL